MRKQWKIGVALCLVMVLLFGCNGNKGKDARMVTDAFLQALQNHNVAVAQEYSLWEKEELELYRVTEEDYIAGIDEQLQEEVLNKVMQFTYVIEQVYEKEDNAAVSIELNMYSFKDALKQGIEEAEKKLKNAGNKNEAEKAQQEVLQILFEKMQKSEDKHITTLKVNLVKQNGVWKVSDNNEELQKALTKNIEDILQYTNME